jgi:acetyl esterase/lipase
MDSAPQAIVQWRSVGGKQLIPEGLVPVLFLAAALWGAWFTWNGLRPMRGGRRRSLISFFAGWLTVELALHHLVWQAALVAVFVWAGALRAWPGWVGLAVTAASWAGLWRCWGGARAAEAVVEDALVEALGERYRDDIPSAVQERFAPGVVWRQLALPFPMRHPEVERIRNIVYAETGGVRLRLDVYRRRDRPAGCPTLLQIHGGAWILGSKNEQGIPLMLHLAAQGWVCVSADYRLSPRATFPDHLVDCKRALAWIRAHGAEHGADPGFVVVTGGSAGGHLAALVGLTANQPEYQPGFEAADTSVAACVAFYGVYDFADRDGIWPHTGLSRLLERHVLKQTRAAAPEAYERASPVACIRPDAPPFFVIHGTHDTLVPVESARRFVAAFRARAGSPCVYAEIPGAQHAFEIFPSLRSTFVIHGVERFLAWVYARHAAAVPEAVRAAGVRRAGA